ncbi:MAG: CpaF family protein [Actinobacteria bacterium]|nr:CpaF family protein [Actinomycetota bacterium]
MKQVQTGQIQEALKPEPELKPGDLLKFEGEVYTEKFLKKEIISLLKKRIKDDAAFFTDSINTREQHREKLYIAISSIINERYPSSGIRIDEEMLDAALSEIFGLGIVERYLSDQKVTDIFIQDTEMLIIKDGVKQQIGKVFESQDEVNLIVDRIKLASAKTFDQRVPFLNTELYDGSRCSIVIPPVSDRIYITIRVFNCIDFNLENLLELEMFDREVYTILKNCVLQKKNILIAGSTGSGKTTLLNTLVKLIPESEIINLIQDLPEIKLKNHPYVRMLTTRPKAREIDNEINQDRLVFETLRMKADRIILGEVRDCMAAYQLLQALNTGHRGSFSTIHADSAYDALLRLEMLAMEYGTNLNSAIVKKIVARAIDVVIFLEYEKDENLNIKNRKIKELALVERELSTGGDYKLSFLQ